MADRPSAISFPVFEAMLGLQADAYFPMILSVILLRRDARCLKTINNGQIFMSGCDAMLWGGLLRLLRLLLLPVSKIHLPSDR